MGILRDCYLVFSWLMGKELESCTVMLLERRYEQMIWDGKPSYLEVKLSWATVLCLQASAANGTSASNSVSGIA